MKSTFILLIWYALHLQCFCQGNAKHKPAQGVFNVTLNETHVQSVAKAVYNGTNIIIIEEPNGDCNYDDDEVNLHVVIIGTTCKNAIIALQESNLENCLIHPTNCFLSLDEPAYYVKSVTPLKCNGHVSIEQSFDWDWAYKPNPESTKAAEATNKSQEKSPSKRDAETEVDKSNKATAVKPEKQKNLVTTVKHMGVYIVIIGLKDKNGHSFEPKEHLRAVYDLTIKMKHPLGYLSADEYPLLTFYMIMCIVFVLYAVAWLVMSACNYHDLLRVQFWIGSVILLGLIEKAVHYAEYLNVNTFGISETGIEKLAAFVDCVKRTVARMLVIIVSLGFGIVKPRLGPTLHRVIGLGLLYFVVAIVERMLTIDVYFNEGSNEAMVFMYIPLSIVDSIICYWIFISLLQTMKTLRLRRNITKLRLYRHFANTIVFCVVISVLMMAWAFFYRGQGCSENFVNGWFETACWPMLFSFILLIIMILWRPNANNQRYAYSPMIDGNGSDEEDVEEPMLGGGTTETIKMRGSKKIIRSGADKTEEDLKWIEENIPQTVADAALPAILDSDEEEMTIKYEMNKME